MGSRKERDDEDIMTKTLNLRGLLLLLFCLLTPVVFAVHHFLKAPKIEMDISHLEEYGMIRLRCSENLPIWETEEEGRIEVTKQDGGESKYKSAWPGEWCYITLTEGSGKYTFHLRGENQSSQEPPIKTRRLEVTNLKPMANVHGFENVQLISDGKQGIWVRRVYDKTETGQDEIISIQKAGDGSYQYFYTLGNPGTWEFLPITEGNGDYMIKVHFGPNLLETGTSVKSSSGTAKINLSDPNIAFLIPSSVISYNKDSICVAIAAQLTQGLETTQEKIDTIVDYVINHLTYDIGIWEEGQKNPDYALKRFDADQILERGTGICGDYAALTTAMLRSQGIPCKYVGGSYITLQGETSNHAWVEVQTDEDQWTRFDPTSTYSAWVLNADNEEFQRQTEQAIKDDERYFTKYYL